MATDWTRWAPLLLTLAAFALRLYHLDYQSIWSDEHYSIILSAASVGDILRVGMLEEPHPPLYNLLLHFWGLTTGNGVLAIRYFSLVAGVASVPLIYALGRRMSSPETGFLAALLMAISPYQVAHSQDARMYALVTGLVLLANLALLHALADPRPRTWGLFVTATVLATYTHHYAAFALVACNLYFLALTWWPPIRARAGGAASGLPVAGSTSRALKNTRSWLAAQAAIFVLYIPWFFSLIALSGKAGYEPSVTLPAMFQQLGVLFSGGGLLGESGGLVTGGGAAAIFVLGLVEQGRRAPRTNAVPLLLTMLAMIVPILIVYGLQEVLHKQSFHERYLMFLSPFFYLAIAAGLRAVHRLHWLLAALLIAASLFTAGLGVFNHYFDAKYANGDYKGIAAYLQAHGRPRDAILLSGEVVDRLFPYYYRGQLPVLALDPGDDVPAKLKAWSGDYDRIWFMPYWQTDLDSRVEDWLAANLYPAGTDWFANARLQLYGVASEPAAQTSGARFGDDLELASFSLAITSPAGEIAPLTLRWRIARRLGDDFKVSLRLTDQQGHLYWQADTQPKNGLLPTSQWTSNTLLPDRYGLPIPPGTPPGVYALHLRVYGAGGELPVSGGDDAASAGSGMRLGEIQVTRGAPTAASEVAPGRRLTLPPMGDIALLGLDLNAGAWRAGSSVTLGLYWQAAGSGSPGADRQATLRLVGKGDEVVAQRHQPLLSTDYPTSQWQLGEVVRAVWDLAIPATAPASECRLQVGLDGDAAWVTLATIQVEARPRVLRAPDAGHPLTSIAGPGMLVGYDLPAAPVRPGTTVELALYWKALATAGQGFKVFAHVLNREGVLVAQQDGEPCQGACPTDSWVAGEYLRDVYRIALPADLAPGDYQLEIGMYDPATVRRLPMLDESGLPQPDDRLLLGGLRVEGR